MPPALASGPTVVATKILIANLGYLTTASVTGAPLIMVFGGVDVHGKRSGVYMYDFFNPLLADYHVFVAASNGVNGLGSYSAVTQKLSGLGISPGYQILYLFSGGYAPGKSVLNKYGPRTFKMVYLVDIWMKKDDYYPKAVAGSPSNFKYFYTAFGANDTANRDSIAKKVPSKLIPGGSMADHLSTNKAAVADLTANY